MAPDSPFSQHYLQIHYGKSCQTNPQGLNSCAGVDNYCIASPGKTHHVCGAACASDGECPGSDRCTYASGATRLQCVPGS